MSATPLAEQTAGCSAEEWQARVELAACYRLIAHFGMTDLVYTHISVRVPGAEGHFLINPYGLMFDEISASNLVKVDHEGQLVEPSEHGFNPAGFTIHSAVHMARGDVACVLHTHTTAGMAVAAQADGLLPLNQISMAFYDRLAYHDYEGIALDLDERERLVRDLGDHRAMILRNHGLLTAGRTVPEAFILMFWLERACALQVGAQAGGGKLVVPPAEVCEHAAQQFQRDDKPLGELPWKALIRMLDREQPDYRD